MVTDEVVDDLESISSENGQDQNGDMIDGGIASVQGHGRLPVNGDHTEVIVAPQPGTLHEPIAALQSETHDEAKQRQVVDNGTSAPGTELTGSKAVKATGAMIALNAVAQLEAKPSTQIEPETFAGPERQEDKEIGNPASVPASTASGAVHEIDADDTTSTENKLEINSTESHQPSAVLEDSELHGADAHGSILLKQDIAFDAVNAVDTADIVKDDAQIDLKPSKGPQLPPRGIVGHQDEDGTSLPMQYTACEAVDDIDAEVIEEPVPELDTSPIIHHESSETPVEEAMDEVSVKEQIQESDAEPANSLVTPGWETGPVGAMDTTSTNGASNGIADEFRIGIGLVEGEATDGMIGEEPPTPTSLPEAGPSSSLPTLSTSQRRTQATPQKKTKMKSPAQSKSKTPTKGKAKGKGKGKSNPIVIPDSDSEVDPEELLDTSPPETALLLPHGFQPVETSINNHYLYVFFRFCAERHRMTVKREDLGVPRDSLTEDECMYEERVGNVYRELDPGSKRIKDIIMGEGSQSYEEVCFRVLLNAGFYVPETFQALQDGLGEVPNWKTFNLDTYESILYERSVIQKQVIYTSAFQLVPPTVYFGRNLPHFAATLRFVKALMESGLPQKLKACKYAVDASHILQTFPSLGGFLAQNILVSMNDSTEFTFHYRNFATCGPGSRAYLQRIFGKQTINHVAMEQAGLKWLYDNQWRYWARLSEDPPHAWKVEKGMRPGMRVLDFENALCWAHRYVNAYQRKGFRSFADIPPPTYDPLITEEASMPAWCDDPHQLNSPNRASFMGDYEEESQKLDEEEGGEGVYEIEKIICRKGHRTDKNGLFRVRWKGYPPEEDTWERATTLAEGAEEALKEWLDWEESVWGTIARITREDPYTRPWPGVKGEPKEEAEGDTKPVTTSTRGKRGRQSIGTAGPNQSQPISKRIRGETVKVEA